MKNLDIKSVLVILDSLGPDTILITLNLPSTMPKTDPKVNASVSCQAMTGYGAQWVRENLGCEPEIMVRR